MIQNMILNPKKSKFEAVQAYFSLQLIKADVQNGDVCVQDVEFVRDTMHKIVDIIKENNNTHKAVYTRSLSLPFLSDYYNSVGDIVGKHFKVGDGWIPAFLALEVFRQFTEKGYKDFEDIDFLKLLAQFEKGMGKGKNEVSRHYKCANEIVDTLTKKRVLKKYRKNRR